MSRSSRLLAAPRALHPVGRAQALRPLRCTHWRFTTDSREVFTRSRPRRRLRRRPRREFEREGNGLQPPYARHVPRPPSRLRRDREPDPSSTSGQDGRTSARFKRVLASAIPRAVRAGLSELSPTIESSVARKAEAARRGGATQTARPSSRPTPRRALRTNDFFATSRNRGQHDAVLGRFFFRPAAVSPSGSDKTSVARVRRARHRGAGACCSCIFSTRSRATA